jgi:hypothetical protein
MMEYKITKKPPADARSAREEQEATTGFSPRPNGRSTPIEPPAIQVDDTTRRIAENLGFDDINEYIKWAKVGQ